MVNAIGTLSSVDQTYPPPPPAPIRTEVAAARVGVETTRSALIEIVTADGDRVSISATAASKAGIAAAAGQAESAEGTVEMAAGSYTASSSRSMTVTVEGSLEDDEIADIGRLLAMLERGAARETGGTHGKGRHRGHEHGRHEGHDVARRFAQPSFESLAGFTAAFSTSRSYEAAAAYRTASVTPEAPATGTASAQAPVAVATPASTVETCPADSGEPLLEAA